MRGRYGPTRVGMGLKPLTHNDVKEIVDDALKRHLKPAPDANICFEILAKAFFYDTKMMAPGKSIAAAANPPYTEKDRSEAWDKWLKENDVPEPTPDALVEGLDFPDLSERATRVYDFLLGDMEGDKLEPLRDIDEIRSMVRFAAKAAHEKAGDSHD